MLVLAVVWAAFAFSLGTAVALLVAPAAEAAVSDAKQPGPKSSPVIHGYDPPSANTTAPITTRIDATEFERSIAGAFGSSTSSMSARRATKAADHAIPIGPAPRNAAKVLDRVTAKGAPFPGYKGGGQFDNVGAGMRLPEAGPNGPIKYREWDVNPTVKGVDRGPERLVTGSDGAAYSTRDHYQTFVRIR